MLPESGIKLDFGCGFAAHHSKHPGSIGLDLKRGLADVIGDVENAPFRSSCADMIILSNIIEHVNSLRVLHEARRILKVGGRMKIVTPNALSIGRILATILWRNYDPHSPTHIQVFGRSELANLLREAGFQQYIIELKPIYFQKGIKQTMWRKLRAHLFTFISFLLPGFANTLICVCIKSNDKTPKKLKL